ncbi:hypothetical protein, partial [Streptomyces tubercidicus]|uniref:hypothetical protein n=1 Tax=Streptomyces tubercidicus TaxID=47759 RepID=UPI001C3F5A1B
AGFGQGRPSGNRPCSARNVRLTVQGAHQRGELPLAQGVFGAPALAVAAPGHLPLTGAFGARGWSEARSWLAAIDVPFFDPGYSSASVIAESDI